MLCRNKDTGEGEDVAVVTRATFNKVAKVKVEAEAVKLSLNMNRDEIRAEYKQHAQHPQTDSVD